jgi:DUF4097 and DUF4098 domain-containing protein YvlB
MKTIILMVFFTFFVALSAFCSGNLELVNTQEIGLDNIIDVKVLYSSERVFLLMGTTDTLIIKEYMSENNSKYFANITNSGNTVTIENGRSPFRPILNTFNRRLEVYLPLSYRNSISIKTSSGNIETSDLFCSKIALENSSGNISVKSITANAIDIKARSGNIDIGTVIGDVSVEISSGNIALSMVNGSVNVSASSGKIDIGTVTGDISIVSSSGNIRGERIQGSANLRARGGSIDFGTIDGNVTAETSSGNITLRLVNGSVDARVVSGSISCTVGTHARDISLNASSGNVRLNLPRDLNFNFTSRISSGRLTAPFLDRLSSPATDRDLTQGFVGNDNGSEEISTVNIRTGSGNIRIEWA